MNGEGQNKVALYDMGEVKESNTEFDKKSLKVKGELKDGHTSQIHSIQWEDTEANEGLIAKELITADSNMVLVWDLKTG